MGGTKRRVKTKWRKVSLAELSDSHETIKETYDKPQNAADVKVQETQSDTTTNENHYAEESSNQYVNYYGYPQGIMYRPGPYYVYNGMEVPIYPNFLVPSDLMYRSYYAPSPSGMNPASSAQEYNPAMQVPLVQEYAPLMQVPPVQEYNQSMNDPSSQDYNPAIYDARIQGYNPPMHGPPVQEYNSSMHAPPVQEYNSSINASPVQEYDASNAASTQEFNPLMNDPPVQEYNTLQYQAPPTKDPIIFFFSGPPVYPTHAHDLPLTYNWRNRRGRRPHNGYSSGRFIANRNQYSGNEEERYGSTVLRTNRRSGVSGNQPSHGNTMTSEASNSSGEEVQETEEKQPVFSEDRSGDRRTMNSSNADRNGNGKGQPNVKHIRKTEYCGTHTRKTQGKGDSTNNNFEFGQEDSSISPKSLQRDSNKEVPKNKTIMSLQSEMDSSKDDSNDKIKTAPQVVNNLFDDSSNGKDIVDSTKKVSKNTDIANFQSISVSLKENSIVSSQAVPVESRDPKIAVGDSNENSSKNKIQAVEIDDNECNDFQSIATRIFPDNTKKLKEIKKCCPNHKNISADENVIAKGDGAVDKDVKVDENVAEDENIQTDKQFVGNKSVATAGTVIEHSFPGIDKELQGINNCKFDHKNFAVDKNIEADDNIAIVESVAETGTVVEHSSPDNDKESQEINKCKLDKEIIESNKNVSEHKNNTCDKEQQKLFENRPRSPYPDSLCIVPEIANPITKVLNAGREESISELSGKNSANEKSLPIVPIPRSFEANNNKIELEPKRDCSTPNVGPVPTASKSILETSVSFTNEALPTQSHEILSYAQTNPFDEKLLISKSIITPSVLQSSNSETSIIKTDVEMKPLTPMQSMRSNQSIYKLAYNESITSSETNSRSLSPVDPESQVPSSIVNDEIIVHEADTDSDAGSEDVELIPHRYECETSLNKNRNVYVNKLSLAVELLRTQESLPYDDHFKRVVEDNDPSAEDTVGEVNFGFEEDLTSFNTSKGRGREIVVTSPSKSNKLPSNSGASSSVVNDDGFNDSCEEAREMTLGTTIKNKDATKEVKAANRRYQVHLRHYFSPRAMTNPCLCCVLM